MHPFWLEPPPVGLSEAERRALEAFFVAADVKDAATLLSLSGKTIENELRAARLTMGETKSWVAAIKYVFHAKKHGFRFAELVLTSRVERQIRRLVEDHLEKVQGAGTQAPTHSQEIVRFSKDSTEPVHSDEDSRPVELSLETVNTDSFDIQLRDLIGSAASTYSRKRPKGTLTLGLSVGAALLAITTLYALTNRRPSLDQIDARMTELDSEISQFGVAAPHAAESAHLVEELASWHQQEVWGTKEPAIIAVMVRHHQQVETGVMWARANDRPMEFRTLANGHRGFRTAKCLLDTWFPLLREAIAANSSDKSVFMVRALNGVTYGALNEGDKSKATLSEKEASDLAFTSANEALKIVDRSRDPYDYANSLRHLAMSQPSDRNQTRMELCQKARALYEHLGGELGERGIAQCLLSMAQGGVMSSIEKGRWAVMAYRRIAKIGNPYVDDECIRELSNYLPDLLPSKAAKDLLISIRGVFWEEAGKTIAPDIQFSLLQKCLTIDGQVRPENIPVDIQGLVLSHGSDVRDRGVKCLLGGFAFARLASPDARVKQSCRDSDGGFEVFESGQKLDPTRAIDLAMTWKDRPADTGAVGH